MVAEKVFAVIAESTRRDILEALAQESKAVGQLVDELGVSQPTVSKHLRVLREAGVVTMRAQGQKRFYGINTEPLELVSAWLDSLGAAAAPDAAAPAAATVPAAAQAPVAQAPAAQAVRPAAKAAETGKGSAPAQSNGQDRAGAAHVGVAAAVAAAPGAAAQARPATAGAPAQASRPAAATATPVLPSVGAVQASASTPAAGTRPAAVAPSAAGTATGTVTRLAPAVVQSNDVDGGMQGQISRSVGRAANKAVDLLANLPALPKLRRKKD